MRANLAEAASLWSNGGDFALIRPRAGPRPPSPAGEGTQPQAFPRGGRWCEAPDEGRVCGYDPSTGQYGKRDPHQSPAAITSASALRAASGGCASTRACGRSPEGEALETQKRGRFRALSACRKRCAHPLAPSARGLRPQAVGERTVRLSEIFRAMARFSPSAPSGHLPRRGRFFDKLRFPYIGKAFSIFY